MHTTIFNLYKRRYTLQSVAKVFRNFNLLEAQENQQNNLIEDAVINTPRYGHRSESLAITSASHSCHKASARSKYQRCFDNYL